MKKQRPLAYETESSIFAVRLREFMKLRKLNQEALAKKVGKRRQTISLYTNGQSKPDLDTLVRLVEVLDVSAEYLLGLTDDSRRHPNAVDELHLSERAIKNITRINDQDTNFPPLMQAASALIGSKRFFDIVTDLATYWFGKGVMLKRPDGEQLFIPIESELDFMEFIRPSCLSRIQENLIYIKADIDNNPRFDISTKIGHNKSDEEFE